MSRAIITNNNEAADNKYKVKIDNTVYNAQGITKDELNTGDVNIIDYYNKNPSDSASWGLRVLPNKGEYTYKTDKIWKTVDELAINNCKHELFRAFFLSCEENPKWQDERPLYKSGVVISITDDKYMKVRVSPTNHISTCRCDYMMCDTNAFSENDVVVIKYEQPSLGIAEPVVVGFWTEPKSCCTLMEEFDTFDSDIWLPETSVDTVLEVVNGILIMRGYIDPDGGWVYGVRLQMSNPLPYVGEKSEWSWKFKANVSDMGEYSQKRIRFACEIDGYIAFKPQITHYSDGSCLFKFQGGIEEVSFPNSGWQKLKLNISEDKLTAEVYLNDEFLMTGTAAPYINDPQLDGSYFYASTVGGLDLDIDYIHIC